MRVTQSQQRVFRPLAILGEVSISSVHYAGLW